MCPLVSSLLSTSSVPESPTARHVPCRPPTPGATCPNPNSVLHQPPLAPQGARSRPTRPLRKERPDPAPGTSDRAARARIGGRVVTPRRSRPVGQGLPDPGGSCSPASPAQRMPMPTTVLRDRGGGESPAVTNMELFFDLVYVFAVTQRDISAIVHSGPAHVRACASGGRHAPAGRRPRPGPTCRPGRPAARAPLLRARRRARQ